MAMTRIGRTERARYWAELVAAWEQSGLSQAEFCRRRGIKAVSFAWWKRRLAMPVTQTSRQSGRPAKQSAPFVELRMPSGSLPHAYEVMLAGGRSIRVPAQFDPQMLSRLIAVVESC